MTITDDDPAPGVTAATAAISVTEGNGTSTQIVNIPVELSEPSGAPVSVNYQTTNMTAVAGMGGNNQVLLIPIKEQNSSGQSGWAMLTAKGASTEVMLAISPGAQESGDFHIHSGQCATPGGVVHSLVSIATAAGTIEFTGTGALKSAKATVPVTLASLRDGNAYINVHRKSVGTTTACGDIPAEFTSITIPLKAMSGSGQNGWATLIEQGATTDVVVSISPGALESEVNHIHTGQCGPGLGGAPYPLTDIAGSGVAVSNVNASLSSLRNGNFAINLHQKGNAGVYTACGNIPAAVILMPLHQDNASGQEGWAMLTAKGASTEVMLAIRPGASESEMVHIHSGQCGSLGSVVHHLFNIATGAGTIVTTTSGALASLTATVPASMRDLRNGDFAINLHQKDNAGVYTACGDIPRRRQAGTIALNPDNSSGQSGFATLIDRGAQTEVVLSISPGSLSSELVHIHSGQCGPTLGGVVHNLYNIATAAGTYFRVPGGPLDALSATVPVSLASLRTGGFAVNLHQKGNAGTYTACGSIPRAMGDYAAAAGTLTIPPGSVTGNIQVLVNGDDLFEPTETFKVTISQATSPSQTALLAIANVTTTITIINDDLPPLPTFALTPATAGVSENTGTGTVELKISVFPAPTTTASVSWRTADGSAKSGQDFGATTAAVQLSGVEQFGVGQTSTKITIPIIDDNVQEPATESFKVELYNASTGSLISLVAATSTVVISDDDPAPTASVPPTLAAPEPASGVNFTANIPITLTAPSAFDVTVAFDTADTSPVSAIAGTDYNSTSGSVTITAGQTGGAISVVVIGDDILELGGEQFLVRLLTAGTTNATVSATASTTEVTIADQPTLTIADTSVTEGDTASIAVSLQPAADGTVTVQYSTSDGTAKVGTDYLAKTGTLTFAPGVTTTNVTVDTVEDQSDEPQQENFKVSLSNPTGSDAVFGDAIIGRPTSTVTIADDDPPPTASVPATFTAPEPASGVNFIARIPVTLTAPSAFDVTLLFNTADTSPVSAIAGTDYNSTSSSLTIQAGQPGGIISVVVIGDDILELGGEQFLLHIYSPTNASVSATASTTVVTIADQPTLTVDDATVTEGGVATIPVSLRPAADGTVTVQYKTLDATAKVGADYQAKTGTVTFAAGVTSSSITINTLQDQLDEDPETFKVALSSPTGSDAVFGDAIIGRATSTVTITDDDPLPVVEIAGGEVEENEPGSITLGLRITPVSGRDVSVDFNTSDETATAGLDYQQTSGTLIIKAGTTTASITVGIKDDRIAEGPETFFVNLSAATNATGTPTSSTVKIIDDDPALKLFISDDVVLEGQTAVLEIRQDRPAATTISVEFATWAITAESSTDYTHTTGTATISPGSTSTSVTVSTSDDAVEEDAERFIVRLSRPTTTRPILVEIADGVGLVTINDDEPVATVITVTSRGEAVEGDEYYVVVAGGTPTTGTMGTLGPISDIPAIIRRMLGLDTIRSKAATYAMLGTASSTDQDWSFDIVGGGTVTTSLNVVGERSNRNYYLVPGMNYTGLGLVPLRAGVLKIPLHEQNNSGQVGSAVLTSLGSQTEVVINVFPAVTASGLESELNHIHNGQCGPTLGGVAYGLNAIVDGHSTTIVNASLEMLRAGNFAINTHKKGEAGVYTSCRGIPTEFDRVLAQPVANADQSLVAALKALLPNNIRLDRDVVRLLDVVKAIYAFDGSVADANPNADPWLKYFPGDRLAGVDLEDTSGFRPEPYQGMLMRTRRSGVAPDGSLVRVFDKVWVPGYGTTSVPIRMTVIGPFLNAHAAAPVIGKLRHGWNLVAPHTRGPARFETVFRDVLIPEELATRAIALITRVTATTQSPIVANVVREWAIATLKRTIWPQFSYWVNINKGSIQGQGPILTPADSEPAN